MFGSFKSNFSAQSNIDLKDGLEAYLPMGEASGNLLDSHNSFDFAPNGGPTYGATGKNGDAIEFDGTGDFFDLASGLDSELDFTGALTIAAWVKFDVVNTSQYVVSKWSSSGDAERQYALRLNTAGTIAMQLSADGSTVNSINSSTTLIASTWYHVVVCYDPSTLMHLYLDGVLEDTKSSGVPASLFSCANHLCIGARDPAGAVEMDGVIDEVAIYSKYRPEIAPILYNGGLGKFYADF